MSGDSEEDLKELVTLEHCCRTLVCCIVIWIGLQEVLFDLLDAQFVGYQIMLLAEMEEGVPVDARKGALAC